MIVALLVALGLSMAATAPAQAATAAQIDDVSFQNETFADGSRQALHVKWSLPDGATAPATLSLAFPEELRGYADTFDMVGPNGERAGTCSVTTTGVECTIDDSFIRDHPYGVSGEFWFDVSSQLKNKESEQHSFDFGSHSQTVDVEANPNWCTDNCDYTGQGVGKWGSYNNADDTIVWTVQIPAPEQGIPAGRVVTITDVLDTSAFELVVDSTYPRVLEGKSLVFNSWDREVVSYAVKPAGEVTWSPDNLTASFVSVAGAGQGTDLGAGARGTDGSFYQAQFKVKVLDEGKARKYTNSAEYTIEGEGSGSTNGSATRYSGGATVVGQNFGRFQVTKELTGDTVLNPTFTVSYEAFDGATSIGTGTFQIKSGQSYISDEFFKGTRIVLTEITPTDPENVTWAAPVFLDADGNPITELTFSTENGNLGQISEIRLVNEATLQTSAITARKVVENPDNVTTGVNDYRIAVTRQADVSKGITPLVGGQLLLPADGTEVTVNYPAGTGYRFFENFVPTPAGTTWADPVYTVNGVEYTEDEYVELPLDGSIELTVTNRITQNVGGFSITKSVSGDGASLVPAGTEFTVNYSYTAVNGFEAGSGTVTVTAGETSPVVADIPEGATVTLDEVRPVNPLGGTWGEPQFDVAQFEVLQDQTVEISLDNPISWNSGNFSVLKNVDGDGAALVDDATTFGVDYTYTLPADLGIEPGTGTGQLVVQADGSVTTSTDLPYGTEVTLSEATPPAIAGGTWTNAIFDQQSFTIGDETTFAVELTNTIEADLGSFSITKAVTGTGEHLVSGDTTFTVNYTYPAGDGFAAGEGSVEVTGDGTPATVSGIPANAVVTLTEATPAAITGGTWEPALFNDGNIVNIEKDATAEVALTNIIDLNAGQFSVQKQVEGTGAALVPSDATFTVHYSYPAANGYDAGSGALEVPVNGTAVTSAEIPFGAEVALTEDQPLAVTGAKWSGSAFSESGVTIGDRSVSAVVLTNTIDRVDPAKPVEPQKPALASTGGGSALPIIGGAAALLLLSAGALIVARRRA